MKQETCDVRDTNLSCPRVTSIRCKQFLTLKEHAKISPSFAPSSQIKRCKSTPSDGIESQTSFESGPDYRAKSVKFPLDQESKIQFEKCTAIALLSLRGLCFAEFLTSVTKCTTWIQCSLQLLVRFGD